MNAIVTLLKQTILIGLFVFLTIAIAGFMLVATNDTMVFETKLPILVGIVVVTFLVFLAHAGIAVVLSIHDRHDEIAEGVHRIADAIDRHASPGGGQ